MIGLSSYLMSIIMVTNSLNVHYYERYVSLVCCLDNTLEPRRGNGIPRLRRYRRANKIQATSPPTQIFEIVEVPLHEQDSRTFSARTYSRSATRKQRGTSRLACGYATSRIRANVNGTTLPRWVLLTNSDLSAHAIDQLLGIVADPGLNTVSKLSISSMPFEGSSLIKRDLLVCPAREFQFDLAGRDTTAPFSVAI
jgi:hypothetical protein